MIPPQVYCNLLLVCGGRWYAHPVTSKGNTNIHCSEQRRAVYRSLTRLREQHYFDGIVEGGATGVDTAAHEWAVGHGYVAIRVPVQRGESPLARNERMWRQWRHHIYGVAAFPGGEGTDHMVRTVQRESPIPIHRLPHSEPVLRL
jgi:hypothetical protein